MQVRRWKIREMIECEIKPLPVKPQFERNTEWLSEANAPLSNRFLPTSKNMDPKCAKDIHQALSMQDKHSINQSSRTFFDHPLK